MMNEERGKQTLTTADIAGREPRGTARPADVERAERAGVEETAAPPRAPTPDGESLALFSQQDSQQLRSRWDTVQASFVDEPRRAVEQADQLVAEVIRRLAETFASERQHLESQWSREGDVSTEDLRLALQRYRSFFDRLLSV